MILYTLLQREREISPSAYRIVENIQTMWNKDSIVHFSNIDTPHLKCYICTTKI